MLIHFKIPIRKKISEDLIEVCDLCKQKAVMSFNQIHNMHLILFIPFFGKKSYYLKCSSCGEHTVHKDYWTSFVHDKFVGFLDTYEKFPNNKESAIKSLEFYKIEGNKEKRLEIAGNIIKYHSDDASALDEAASVYKKYFMFSEALKIYEKVYFLKQDNKIRYEIADLSIKCGDFNNAYKMLIENGKPYFENSFNILFDLVKLLIKTYNYHLAYSVIVLCIEYFKITKINGELPSLIKQVEKQLNISTSILPKKNKLMILAIISLILICTIISSSIIGYFLKNNQKIYFVNGFKYPVNFNIQGKSYKKIKSDEFLMMFIPEGETNIQINVNDNIVSSDKINIDKTDLITKITNLINNNTFYVYNIANGGIIYHEIVEYIIYDIGDNTEDKENFKLYLGEKLLKFENIDYPFSEFPKTLELSRFEFSKKKTGIGLLKMDPDKIALYLTVNHYPSNLITSYINAQVDSGYDKNSFGDLKK